VRKGKDKFGKKRTRGIWKLWPKDTDHPRETDVGEMCAVDNDLPVIAIESRIFYPVEYPEHCMKESVSKAPFRYCDCEELRGTKQSRKQSMYFSGLLCFVPRNAVALAMTNLYFTLKLTTLGSSLVYISKSF
jgi:hypothetical protein